MPHLSLSPPLRRVFALSVGILACLGLATVLGVAAFFVLISPKKLPEQSTSLSPFHAAGLTPEEMYLDLLKKTLTRYQTPPAQVRYTLQPRNPIVRVLYNGVHSLLAFKSLELVRVTPADTDGYTWGTREAEDAETMIGLKRLDNLQFCVTDILRRKVPGDLIEAGVWRGGATIFMRAILQAYKVQDRNVWVADSFEGLPKADPALNLTNSFSTGDMAVSLPEVQRNFARYGLLDGQVHFLKGFFKDTLPQAPIGRLAVLRIDADLYESTMDAMNYLYPKLSVGGYIILDDYVNLPDSTRATDDYRKQRGITEPIQVIDHNGAFWQKLR